MSKYFDLFSTIDYNVYNDDSNNTQAVTNIFIRQKLTKDAIENAVIYYPYVVKDDERPDILAHSYYGDVKYTWLIFFANDIVDPYHQWPLTQKEFENFIIKKYGSISTSTQTIHSYNRILRAQTASTDEVLLEVDLTTYNSLNSSDRKTISKFDYELSNNEAKREIKLIEDTYAASILNEVRRSFS